MFNSKYGSILTIFLIIIIVVIVGILGYFGYQLFCEKENTKANEEAIDEFDIKYSVGEATDGNVVLGNLTVDNSTSTSTGKVMLGGYEVIATIRIPKISLKYAVLDQVTKKSLETAVALLYTENGINQVGNSVIVGHNYRNSQFFSKNDKLSVGDFIYIKDKSGTELKYKITEKFETAASDASFYKSNGATLARVILSTCTDDASTTDKRLIIIAEATVDTEGTTEE